MTEPIKPFYQRHKGPFSFTLVRRDTGTGPTSEALKGRTFDGEEIEGEALALLSDPRDTITGVHVWSEGEQQYVMSFPNRPGVKS